MIRGLSDCPGIGIRSREDNSMTRKESTPTIVVAAMFTLISCHSLYKTKKNDEDT